MRHKTTEEFGQIGTIFRSYLGLENCAPPVKMTCEASGHSFSIQKSSAMSSEVQSVEAGPEIVLSGPERRWISVILIVLGLLSSLQGLALLARQRGGGGWSLLVTGGGMFLLAVVHYYRVQRQKRTLQVTPDGFIYTSYTGSRTCLDDDIMCVSYVLKPNYFGGNLQSFTRRFAIWIEADPHPERVLIVTKIRPGRRDELGDWISRVITGLHQDALAAYHSGQVVEGEGWQLQRGRLIATLKSREQVLLPLDEIQAIDDVEDHICIWRRGDDFPLVRIPVDRSNAHLLRLLLNDLVQEAPEEAAPTTPGALGRVIFERKRTSAIALAIGYLLAACLSIPGVILVTIAITELVQRRVAGWFTLLFGMLFLTISLLLIWLLWRSTRLVFRCHVHGVKLVQLFGETQLAFEQLATFTYAATKVYTHGVYVGTTVLLKFAPLPGQGLKPIQYSAVLKGDDAELDRLKDHASAILAHKLLKEWEAVGHVPWLPHIKFLRDALEYRTLGLMGRRAAQTIPYRELTTWDFQEGSFRLFGGTLKKPVLAEGTGQPNFYPGLILLQELIRRTLEQTVTSDEASDEMESYDG